MQEKNCLESTSTYARNWDVTRTGLFFTYMRRSNFEELHKILRPKILKLDTNWTRVHKHCYDWTNNISLSVVCMFKHNQNTLKNCEKPGKGPLPDRVARMNVWTSWNITPELAPALSSPFVCLFVMAFGPGPQYSAAPLQPFSLWQGAKELGHYK